MKSSQIFPENVDADYLLSELINYEKDKKHQKKMLFKYENINFNNNKKKSILLFSIAKSFEDQKKYDQAAEFLKLSNNEINSTVKIKIND